MQLALWIASGLLASAGLLALLAPFVAIGRAGVIS